MEQMHPIPQNVTNFQFKLVGDMTLKQFCYLVAGIGFAYFVFIIFSRDFPILAWPVILFSALLGIAFAFIPIGSRPLDYWLAAFLKAIYSPTKRIWVKNKKNYKENSLFNSRLVIFSTGVPNIPQAKIMSPIITPTARPTPLPTKEELQKTVELAKQAQQLQMRIIQSERDLSQIKQQATQPSAIPIDYSQQVNKVLADLKNLVNRSSEVDQQIKSIQKPADTTLTPIPELVLKEKVKIVVPVRPKQAQIALTTFPNVINGITKDSSNNYLEGVIAVIYDKEGLPVRALKTNKLGQFTGSTPLPNGTYTLELEKDNYTFDVLQIELTGQVLPPLMITTKQ